LSNSMSRSALAISIPRTEASVVRQLPGPHALRAVRAGPSVRNIYCARGVFPMESLTRKPSPRGGSRDPAFSDSGGFSFRQMMRRSARPTGRPFLYRGLVNAVCARSRRGRPCRARVGEQSAQDRLPVGSPGRGRPAAPAFYGFPFMGLRADWRSRSKKRDRAGAR